jgi:hypothetical protein
MNDTIQWEILQDGTVTITTDAISGPNHQSADEMLKHLAELLGGDVSIQKRRKGHVHPHEHQQVTQSG